MSQAKQRWGIVGGGLLGMTLAHRLQQAGQQVTIVEAAPQLGGLASPWQLGDFVWDRHYHVTLLSDQALRDLLRELELEHCIEWVQTRTGFYSNGQLYSISNLREFATFPVLNIIEKARLAATILYAAHLKDSQHLEYIRVDAWLRRLSGRRTFEKLWLPLLRAKLGESYRQTSAAFIWAIIARMYAARRTGLKKEMFGYVPGGYARILGRFEALLKHNGVRVMYSQPVQSVDAIPGNEMSVQFNDGRGERFDRVVVTTPGPLAAKLCGQLLPQEAARLRGIAYQGVICASVVLKKALADYYITNITDGWVPFTAVIEMSALVSRQHFGGNALVYLPKYVMPDDPAFSLSDEQIESQFLSALERLYPRFQRSDVVCFKVSRVRYVLPLTTLGYSQKLPPVITSVPGLYTLNSAHIINGTLNVNETVQLANTWAKRLLQASYSPADHMAAAV